MRRLIAVGLIGLSLGAPSCKAPKPGHPGVVPHAADLAKPQDQQLESMDFALHLQAKDAPEFAAFISNVTGHQGTHELVLTFSSPVVVMEQADEASEGQKLALLGWTKGASGATNVPARIKDVDPVILDKLQATDVKISGKEAVTADHVYRGDAPVYRGMAISKEQLDVILREGIDAPVVFNKEKLAKKFLGSYRSVANTVKAHQNTENRDAPTSIFVSTSLDKNFAVRFTERGSLLGYVFVIRVPANKGVDVDKALPRNDGRSELEVAVVGRIKAEDILGYYDVIRQPLSNPELGTFHPREEWAKSPG